MGDNGASAEGVHGTIDEMLLENSLPSTAGQQIEARASAPQNNARGLVSGERGAAEKEVWIHRV